MGWVVGIDEAGYGPNLGPLVQGAAAWPVNGDCWHRRCGSADDGRVLIDDSKKVYAGPNGLARLETAVLAALHRAGWPDTLADALNRLAPAAPSELAAECWYVGDSRLPLAAEPDHVTTAAGRFTDPLWLRCSVVNPPRFNDLLDRWGSKGAVLAMGLIDLLQAADAELPAGEGLTVWVDKHGGRNYYAAMLQTAFPDSWVVVECEGADESRYRLTGLSREITVIVRPRADGSDPCVALASMACKYLREALMAEFNRFWLARVPGLKPTAGYPTDASRFFAEVRPALQMLGIAESAVWRRK